MCICNWSFEYSTRTLYRQHWHKLHGWFYMCICSWSFVYSTRTLYRQQWHKLHGWFYMCICSWSFMYSTRNMYRQQWHKLHGWFYMCICSWSFVYSTCTLCTNNNDTSYTADSTCVSVVDPLCTKQTNCYEEHLAVLNNSLHLVNN